MPSFTQLHEKHVNIATCAFSPAADLLAYATADSNVHVVRWVAWQKVSMFECGLGGTIMRLTWSPDGKQIAVATTSGEMGIIALEDNQLYPITPPITPPNLTLPPETKDKHEHIASSSTLTSPVLSGGGVSHVRHIADDFLCSLPFTSPLLWAHVTKQTQIQQHESDINISPTMFTSGTYPLEKSPFNLLACQPSTPGPFLQRLFAACGALYPPEPLPGLPVPTRVSIAPKPGDKPRLLLGVPFSSADGDAVQLAGANTMGEETKESLLGIRGHCHEPAKQLASLPHSAFMIVRGLHASTGDMFKPYLQKLWHATVPIVATFVSVKSRFGCGSMCPYAVQPSQLSQLFDHNAADGSIISLSQAPALQSTLIMLAKVIRRPSAAQDVVSHHHEEESAAAAPGGDVAGAVPFGVFRLVAENAQCLANASENVGNLTEAFSLVDACFKHTAISVQLAKEEWDGLCNTMVRTFKELETALQKQTSNEAFDRAFYPSSPLPLSTAELFRMLTVGTATDAAATWLEARFGDSGCSTFIKQVDKVAAAIETLLVTHVVRSCETALVALSEVQAYLLASQLTDSFQHVIPLADAGSADPPPINLFHAYCKAAEGATFLGITPAMVAEMSEEVQHVLGLTQAIRSSLVQARAQYLALFTWLRLLLKHWEARRTEARTLEEDAVAEAEGKQSFPLPTARGTWPTPSDLELLYHTLKPSTSPSISAAETTVARPADLDPLGLRLFSPVQSSPPSPVKPVTVAGDPFLSSSVSTLFGKISTESFTVMTSPIGGYSELHAGLKIASLDSMLNSRAVKHRNIWEQIVDAHVRLRRIFTRLKRRFQPPANTYQCPPIQIDVPILPTYGDAAAAAIMHRMASGACQFFDDGEDWECPSPAPHEWRRLIKGTGAAISSEYMLPGAGPRAESVTSPVRPSAGNKALTTAAHGFLSPSTTGEQVSKPDAIFDSFDPMLWLPGSHVSVLPLPTPIASIASHGRCNSESLLFLRLAATFIEPGASRLWWKRIAGAFLELPPGAVCLKTAFYGPVPGSKEFIRSMSGADGTDLLLPPALPGGGRNCLIVLIHQTASDNLVDGPGAGTYLCKVPYRDITCALISPTDPSPQAKLQSGTELLHNLPILKLWPLVSSYRRVSCIDGVVSAEAARSAEDFGKFAKLAQQITMEACGTRGAVAIASVGRNVAIFDMEEDTESEADASETAADDEAADGDGSDAA